VRTRTHDPLRLEVAAFAADAAELRGEWPLAGFARLVDATHEAGRPGPAEAVHWTLRGELRAARNDAPQVWLHLGGRAELRLACQRCLAPVPVVLEVDRSFLFVDGEDRAAALDAQMEDDVLALPRRLDVHELLEDELLLALPLVPRHARCPTPLPVEPAVPAEAPRTNPFAALQALRRGGGRGDDDGA
jgi:uncharacterized protein